MSEQQVIARAQDISVILLNTVTFVASISALLLPDTPESDIGVLALAALVGWSGYRLATRSRSTTARLIDFGYVLAVSAAIPMFGTDPQLLYTNSVPQVIAGVAVVTCALAHPPKISFLAAVAITAAYAAGSAQVVGWSQVARIPMLFPMLAIEWLVTTVLVLTARTVARRVDQTRADNRDAALRDAIAAAVRDHELEHMALVHDTAASTLRMVGEGAEVSPERIAAQARRDLALLAHEPIGLDARSPIDVAASIRAEAQHCRTPVELTGLERLILDGHTANAIVAVVREALNNADKHAQASRIVIDVSPTAVTVSDDGIGFDPVGTTLGHGVAESIVGRMRRAHGTASVRSSPGAGTVVTVNWQQLQRTVPGAPTVADVDQLTERILVRFGLGIVAFAFVQLAVAVPYAAASSDHPAAQFGLGGLAALVALGGIPQVLGRRPNLLVPAVALMAVVIFLQARLLPDALLGSMAQWPLLATALCILPYLLRIRPIFAVGVLIAFWLGTAIMNFVHHPVMATAYNLALYTAGIVVVQIFVLAFPVLLRDANATAAEEIRDRWAKDSQRRITEALHDDYVRRTSKLIRGVFPLLQALSTGAMDADLRRRARIESRRLRLYIFQARTFANPLISELQPAIADADERGVVVSLNADDNLPRLDREQRRRLLEPIESTLERAVEYARIGLTVVPGELIASIICDDAGSPVQPQPGTADEPRIEVTEIPGAVWISAHHPLPVEARVEEHAEIA
ncbi:ATP-binding protein [Mycobacterium sp. AMU20-3851]|uniref:sensor histidine kinase n=1 Tax=Mycobacterium sp. AMU20-3851 TaxID=3122055 RepID=UPI0037545A58